MGEQRSTNGARFDELDANGARFDELDADGPRASSALGVRDGSPRATHREPVSPAETAGRIAGDAVNAGTLTPDEAADAWQRWSGRGGLPARVRHDRRGDVGVTGRGDAGDPLSARRLPGGAVPALAVDRVSDLGLLLAWH